MTRKASNVELSWSKSQASIRVMRSDDLDSSRATHNSWTIKYQREYKDFLFWSLKSSTLPGFKSQSNELTGIFFILEHRLPPLFTHKWKKKISNLQSRIFNSSCWHLDFLTSNWTCCLLEKYLTTLLWIILNEHDTQLFSSLSRVDDKEATGIINGTSVNKRQHCAGKGGIV